VRSSQHIRRFYRAARAACLIVAIPLSAIEGMAESPWYVPYERALEAQNQGRWKESIEFLQVALREKARPQEKAKTYGLRFVNYIPHYYLGVAYYHLGDTANALKNFELAEGFGSIREVEPEYSDMKDKLGRLTGKAPPPPVAVVPPVEEVQAAPPAEDQSPWYVSYETGLEYIESGDWVKAVENLRRAVAVRTRPEQYARTYGMWFISYLPHYYLGVAYFNQGLWRLANEHLKKSEEYGVIQKFPAEFTRLRELQTILPGKTGQAAVAEPERMKDLLNKKIVDAVQAFNAEEYETATKEFQSVLMLDPYNSVAKGYLARIEDRRNGQPSSSDTGDDFLAGVYEFSRKNFQQAATLLTGAAERDPENPQIAAYLGAAYGELYLASGKNDKSAFRRAREQFTRVLTLRKSFRLDRRIFSSDVIRLFNDVVNRKDRDGGSK
jgi:tetratricopeptide (TPR) repeat protein